MHTPSLQEPLWSQAAAAACRQIGALRAAWQGLRERRAQTLALRRAERELAEMSLHGLRDIGVPEALLARQHRAWRHGPD